MREFKFRAWDIKNNKWFQTELAFYGFHLWGECTLLCPPRIEELKNIIVMQYTGLKDKNGKDIYEEDIVKIKFRFDEYIGVIKFRKYDDWEQYEWHEHYGYVIEINSEKYFSIIDNEIEIIGNNCENPELLKK